MIITLIFVNGVIGILDVVKVVIVMFFNKLFNRLIVFDFNDNDPLLVFCFFTMGLLIYAFRYIDLPIVKDDCICVSVYTYRLLLRSQSNFVVIIR